ncbi:hypothetical protein I4U23_005773 [Adineta vaga]|nr:hypothetical protein I4U23_005773 [Adineta vaga]
MDGNTALHTETNYGELRTLRNQLTNRTAYEEAHTLEIQQLFQRTNDTNRFVVDSFPELFEWVLDYDDLSL